MLKQYENMNGTFVIGTEADYLINLTTNPYYNTNSIGGGVYYNSTLLMELEGYTPATVYLADNDGNILMTDDTDEYGVYYFVNIPSGHNGVAHLYSTYGGYTGYKNVSFATLYSQGGLFNQDIYIKNATVASSTARPPQDGDIIILGFNLNTCNPAIWALLLTAIAFVGTIVLLKDSTGAAQAGAVMAGITFCVTCLIGWIPIWIPFVIGLIILVIFGSKFFSTGG
jgi:hypothetical protein